MLRVGARHGVPLPQVSILIRPAGRMLPGAPLATATGAATVENGMTQMSVTLDLSRIPPGYYLVGIRLPGADWSYSPLIIK